jgi:DMSO/TMAO reductase YedYZ heme-binding membrane subunit
MPNLVIKKPPSETTLYIRVLIFSLIMFAAFYGYTSWMKIPNVLNKAAADTAIVLMGLSMILSGVCYFWNFFDSMIRYRKQLGLIGWAFGLAHVILSFSALQALLKPESWAKGIIWPAFTGVIATIIFTIMALISNNLMARSLGGKWWRFILRTGYIAIIFVFAHVVLLKSVRWITWYQGGMKTLPSLSLLVSIFMVLVLLMRIALWISLHNKSKSLNA